MNRSQWLAIALAAMIFATLSLWAAVASDGFLEADACTHYQYARFALGETHYLVNVWGRPFVTGLYAVPATLAGRIGVRATSLLCALVIALLASRIARDQNYRWPALAFIFVLAQPLVFLHSFSELTELPFALLLTIAFYAYTRKKWLVMAIFVALLPTARPEGFGFILLAAFGLVIHRRWWWIAILPIPILLWTYAGWRIYGRPVYETSLPSSLHWLLWLKHEWPYAEKSAYASGYLLHFVWLLPAVVSPLLTPFVLIGMERSVSPLRKSWITKSLPDHQVVVQALVAAIPLMILAGHSLLYWLGRMASNGELRYMLIVAPFWSLLAAKGWEWTFDRLHWRHPLVFAGVAALLPIGLNFHYHTIPFTLTHDAQKARDVANWFRDSGIAIDYPRLMASNPEVPYFLGVSLTDRGTMREWRKETVAKAPPGTLLVWDPVYGLSNSDTNRIITLEELKSAGWVERADLAAEFNQYAYSPEWRIFFSPADAKGQPTLR